MAQSTHVTVVRASDFSLDEHFGNVVFVGGPSENVALAGTNSSIPVLLGNDGGISVSSGCVWKGLAALTLPSGDNLTRLHLVVSASNDAMWRRLLPFSFSSNQALTRCGC